MAVLKIFIISFIYNNFITAIFSKYGIYKHNYTILLLIHSHLQTAWSEEYKKTGNMKTTMGLMGFKFFSHGPRRT